MHIESNSINQFTLNQLNNCIKFFWNAVVFSIGLDKLNEIMLHNKTPIQKFYRPPR